MVAAAVVAVVAQPSPSTTPSAAPPEPVPGEPVCTVDDSRLVELSGLVALADTYAVVNDGTQFADREGVFFLDQGCQVIDQIGYPSQPRDPEELAWDRQANALWVGDTGDNVAAGTGEGDTRPSAALWRIELGGDRVPVIYRFTYPGGQPRDAEALLLAGDGTPLIISKSASGTAELFRPQELRPSSGPEDTVPLDAVGEVTLPPIEVEHRFGPVAGQVVTGAANAPDGSAVVLRSYTGAFEYDVTDGDVVAAVTTGTPRITLLPDEPLGEAITYSPDGQRLLTVSEVPEGDESYTPVILGFTPTPPPAPEPPPEAAPAAGSGGGGGLFNDLQDIINVIAAVGVLGLLLVAAGVVGIVRARRRRPGPGGRGAAGPGGAGAGPATGRARLPGAAAAPPPGGPEPVPPAAAGVYTSSTAQPPGTEYRGAGYPGEEYAPAEYPGTEYGDAEYRGTEYGGAGYGGTEHRGTEYGASEYRGGDSYDGHQGSEYRGGGYPGADYGAAGYGSAEPGTHGRHSSAYPPDGYPGGGRREPFDQDVPEGYLNQQPERPGQPAPDYYSDDPDYPYEFRGRGRW